MPKGPCTLKEEEEEAQPFDGPFACEVKMEKSANKCDVGPLDNRFYVYPCVS